MYVSYEDLEIAVLELQHVCNANASYDFYSMIGHTAKFKSTNGRFEIYCHCNGEKISTDVVFYDCYGGLAHYTTISDALVIEWDDLDRYYICVRDLKIRIDNKRRDYIC